VPHIYQQHPRGHDWDYWAEHVAQTLVFFGQQLSLRTLGRSTESLPDGRRINYYAEHRDE